MKKMTCVSLLLLLFVSAPNYADMDEAQMQQMMEKMQAMQTCMGNVDPSEMEAFQQKGEHLQAELKDLCAKGKRDEAMNRAMVFGREAASSKALQAMKKCGEGMQQSPLQNVMAAAENPDSKTHHVCDAQ